MSCRKCERCVAAVVFVLALSASASARADWASFRTLDKAIPSIALGAPVAAATTVMLVGQLVYERQLFPSDWAIAELATGAIDFAYATGLVAARWGDSSAYRIISVVAYSLGAWLVTHGVLSLVFRRRGANRERRRSGDQRGEAGTAASLTLAPVLGPTSGVALVGRF